MIMPILIQQLKGVINLALPLIALAFIKPSIFSNLTGVLLCSLGIGAYVAYLTYATTQKQANSLGYAPSAEYKKTFDHMITQCNLKPDQVNVRYGYTDDAVATTMLNTVAVDPLMWKQIETDPQVGLVKQVLAGLLATLPADKKSHQEKIAADLTVGAQQFIFKHELGHVYYRYAIKKVLLCGAIAAIATLVGISVACLLREHIILAIVLGMLAGGLTDLFLSYSSNIFFKYYEEKKADLFAARYSSAQDINAAADFFEKYRDHATAYKKPMGLIAYIPQVILSGHPDGKIRAQYLRDLAAQKNNRV